MKPRQSKIYNWLFTPLFWAITAFIIRMLYLLEQGGTSPLFYHPMLDEKETVDAAMAILNGTASSEPYFKAPGYSWIMAAVMTVSGGAWPWVLRAFQHTCGAILAGMAAWLGGRVSGAGRSRQWATAVAGFATTLYAPLIRLENNLSLDFWAVFFQSAMICILAAAVTCRRDWRMRTLLCAGCMAAAAWLIRPTITIALPFIAVWLTWAAATEGNGLKRGIKTAFIFILPVVLVAAGVLLRNKIVSGEGLVMPWQGGYNLYHANKAGANGRYYIQSTVVEESYANPTRHLAIKGYVESLSPTARQEFIAAPRYGAVDNFWFNITVDEIRADPLSWVSLLGKKSVYLFSDKEIYNYEDFDLQKSLSAILWWMPGRFGVVFPAALASLAMLGLISTRRRHLHVLLWLYIITLGGGIALYYVSGRMRMPLAFPVIVLAGYSAGAFLSVSHTRKILAVALVAGGLVLSWGDWWGVRSESMAHADLARMSNAAWHRERYEQALNLALKAEQLDPDYPVLPRLKGQALYNLGRLEESQVQFQRSVQILGDETSRRNLEVIRKELSKPHQR